MAFESGKTFLLSLKLFQQVVLVQIAKLTLTEYLLGQESLTRAVGRSENLGIIINPRHFWENTLLFFLSKSGGEGGNCTSRFRRPCFAPTNLRAYGQRRKLLRFINSKT
jgi:hypothetical protein